MSAPAVQAGVPAFALSQDGTRYFDIHHTPDDTLDKVDRAQLDQNVAAWAALAWLAADSGVDFRYSRRAGRPAAAGLNAPMGPLTGVRVLDLTRVLAGPWATQLLADFGADVVKVEAPGAGDDTRQWGPPWLRDGSGAPTRESAYFLSTNRGKRSITLDLAQPRRRAAGARPGAHARDVLVENFRVGGLARYGLGYAELAAAHPQLIYCSITGFGQDGPEAARPGYDAMIQAHGRSDERHRYRRRGTGRGTGEGRRRGLATSWPACMRRRRSWARCTSAPRTGRRAAHRPGAAGQPARLARQPEPELPPRAVSRRAVTARRIRTSPRTRRSPRATAS